VGVELKSERGERKEREKEKEGVVAEDLDTTCSNYHQMVFLQKKAEEMAAKKSR